MGIDSKEDNVPLSCYLTSKQLLKPDEQWQGGITPMSLVSPAEMSRTGETPQTCKEESNKMMVQRFGCARAPQRPEAMFSGKWQHFAQFHRHFHKFLGRFIHQHPAECRSVKLNSRFLTVLHVPKASVSKTSFGLLTWEVLPSEP